MRGQQHIQISVFTGLVLTAPFLLLNPTASVLLLVGIFIGSLLPDSDASDRTAKHGDSVLFAFDKINEVFIYPLLLRLFQEKKRHRGILHTVAGVATFSIILTVITGIVFLILNIQFNFWLIGIGLFIGGILHLMEDCCTLSGVIPLYPKYHTAFKGEIATFNRKEKRPNQFASYLAMLFVALVVVQLFYDIALLSMIILTLMAITLSWLGFFAVCRVKKICK